MRKRTNWRALMAAGCLLAVVAVGVSAAVANDEGADPAPPAAQSAASSSAGGAVLDGAKVYGWNCGSCHSERWPKERSDLEWDVIVTHMRVRANMTAAQTEAVLRYLKDNN